MKKIKTIHKSRLKVLFLGILSICVIGLAFSGVNLMQTMNGENSSEEINTDEPITSDPPVDEDFESYTAGTNIDGQGDWYSLPLDPQPITLTTNVVDRSGDNWLQLHDDVNGGFAQAGMDLSAYPGTNSGYVSFIFETSTVANNKATVMMLSDGPWSEIIALDPNGSASMRVNNNNFQVNDSGSWNNIAGAAENTEYLIEIHFKIGAGWHVVINGTQHDNGGDYTYGYAFGSPTAMNVFIVSTDGPDNAYDSYFDEIDFSWYPNIFAPSLSNGQVTPTIATNNSDFTFSVNYTDLDNNAPESINVTIDRTSIFPMTKRNSSDINYTDGCIYQVDVTMPVGNHSYSFSCSDGIPSATLGPFFGPYVEPLWNETSLLGVRIGCLARGGQNPRTRYASGVVANLIARGANLTDITTEFNESLLTNYDIVWVDESTVYLSWTERTIVRDWVSNGGSLILTSDYYSSSYPMYRLLYMFSIYHYQNGSFLSGTSFDVYSHPITRGVNSLYYSSNSRLNIANQPDAILCSKFTTGDQIAALEYGEGKVVAISDDNIPSTSSADNRLLMDNSFGWLHYIPYNAQPPALTSGTVNPGTGTQMTSFTFSVNYTDIDNNEPEFVEVIINGTPWTMHKQDIYDFNYTDGCMYEFSTYLQPGNYTYLFNCTDGKFINTTSNITGLEVLGINANPPSIVGSDVLPVRGYNGSTIFNFSAIYSDVDNNAPTTISVVLNGTLYSMVQRDPLDWNYIDGAVFDWNTTINVTGNYTYFYFCSDGFGASDGPFTELEVIESQPLFFDGMYYDWTGFFNWSYITENGSETFRDGGPGLIEIDSAALSFTGGRIVNISSREMTDTDSGGPYSFWVGHYEFTRIYVDIGIGSEVIIGIMNDMNHTFTVTGEAFFIAMNKSFECWVLEDTWGSKLYYDKYSGLLVNGSFISWGGSRYYTIQIRGTNVNITANQFAPMLAGPRLSPASGSPSTLFTFNVTYADLDNEAPVEMDVVINGVPYAMQKVDPLDMDFTDGAEYTFSTYLQPAPYSYLFLCTDGTYSDAIGPFLGPTVVAGPGMPPILTPGGVFPSTGNNATLFRFNASYTDLDNNAPPYMRVTIGSGLGGTVHDMVKVDPTDNNYMDGCSYEYLTYLNPGNYSHFFSTSDGNTPINSPISFEPYVNISNSIFRDGEYYEWYGWMDQMGNMYYEWGREDFTQLLGDTFSVTTLPNNMFMGGREINGTSRLIKNSFGGWPMWTSEWVKIPKNIGIGSQVNISIYQEWNNATFMVTGETLFDTLDRTFECWVLETGGGMIAYYDKYSGLLVNGTFISQMGVPIDYSFQIRGTNAELAPNDYAPQLTDDGVFPDSGNQDTEFHFTANYLDADDNAPEYVNLVLNGTTYTMERQVPSDYDFNEGVIYQKKMYLPEGVYEYYFECSDWEHVNTTSLRTGLLVAGFNLNAPVLFDPKVIPTSGFNGFTNYIFSVNYTDADNTGPIDINVTINGTTYTMTKLDPLDTDYQDGCIFEFATSINITGNYEYQFNASDGDFETSEGPFTDLLVEAFQINFFNGMNCNWTVYVNWWGIEGQWDFIEENYTYLGDDIFHIISTNINGTIWGTRDFNGITREINDEYWFSFPPFSHEWSRLYTDIDIGSEGILISKYERGDDAFSVTGEALVLAMNRSFECWVLEDDYGSIAYYDKYSGLLVKSLIWTVPNPFFGEWDYYTYELNATNVTLRPNFNAPELTSGIVTPLGGNENDLFNFSVVYTDQDNDLPNTITVSINGIPYSMEMVNPSDMDMSDGTVYQYLTYLPVGNYNFSFECTDFLFSNSTGNITEIVVSPINIDLPELLNSAVSSNFGINTTIFNYTVTYLDPDNNFPAYVNVSINNTNYTMVPADPSDLNVMDGKLYYYSTTLANGIYEYQMFCSDGVNLNSTALFPGPEVSELYKYLNITYFFDDFESGLSQWDIVDGLWHMTNTSSVWPDPVHSPTHAMWYGQEEWGNYDHESIFIGDLISKPIDLTLSDKAILEFYYWKAGWAQSSIYISTDGVNWDYVGQCNDMLPWQRYELDISSYCGNNRVQIKFHFETWVGGENFYRGWLIDDIHIYSGGIIPEIKLLDPEDAENLTTGLNNFTWKSLELPNTTLDYTLQIATDLLFTNLVIEESSIPESPTNTSVTLDLGLPAGWYYWRVGPKNLIFYGNWSNIFSFNFSSTDLYPLANFTANATIIVEGQWVEFSFTGFDGDGPTEYEWDFGDGSSNSTEKSPSHQYTIPGSYNVTVMVNDSDSDIDYLTIVDYITVEVDVPPNPDFYANVTKIIQGDWVQFTFNGTEGNLPVTYSWNFGDSPINSTNPNPVHQYIGFGIFTVALTITDNNGEIFTETKLGYINASRNQLPVADFDANITSIILGPDIQFNFNGTHGDLPETFQWDFGDGSPNATAENPVHTYTSGGIYTVTLTVTDKNSDSDSITRVNYIIVEPDVMPVADFVVNTSQIFIGEWIQFNFTGYEGNDPATFAWDFGDTGTSSLENPIHQYTSENNFTVTLVVTDLNGNVSIDTRLNFIVVEADISPVANFTTNVTRLVEGQLIECTFTGTRGNIPETYEWDFGDGTPNSTVQNPVHQYLIPGNYSIILTIFDRNNDSDTYIVPFIEVEVDLLPISNFVANDTFIIEGEWVQFNFTGSEGNLPAVFQWSFGDGSPTSSLENPVHQYNSSGNYTVTLVVTDFNDDNDVFFITSYIDVMVDLTPVAAFNANTTVIEPNDWVQFTFTGAPGNTPTSFEWDFGDGSANSTLQNPTHQYNLNGTYNVTLRIVDTNGDESILTKVNYIDVTIDLYPVADFTSNVTTIIQGQWVQFTFNGTPGNLPNITFEWDFGDGSGNSTVQDPMHQYTSSGIFNITLTVIDDDGDADTVNKTGYMIVITDQLPLADFDSNITTIIAGESVQFTFNGSEGNSPADYQWDFGLGGSGGNITTQNPEVQYTVPGLYNVTLTVRDIDGDEDTIQRTNYINVTADLAPWANFSVNDTWVIQGQLVSFTFNGNEGNAPASYQWDVGDGTANYTTPSFSHQYNSPTVGFVTITLTVTDTDGDQDTFQWVDAIHVMPDWTPTAAFTANKVIVGVDEVIQFSFTGTIGNSPATFQWDFGDSSGNSTLQSPTHQYSSTGNYTVTLTVTDVDGDSDTEQKIDFIVVINYLPVANFTSDVTVINSTESVQFTFTGFEGDTPVTYQWDFGDNSSNSTARNPTHQYNSPGNYTVILTVIDSDTDSNTITMVDYIEVLDLIPVSIFTANATVVPVNSTVQFNFTGFEGNPPATFQWDFGDGNSSTDPNPINNFTSVGSFNVTLNVTDEDGDWDLYWMIINASIDIEPVATFTANNTVVGINDTIQFIFTGIEGDLPSTFQWDFGDNSTNATVKNPTHAYNATGNYTITLTVKDFNNDTDTVVMMNYIEVTDLVPITNFIANVTSILTGDWVQFNFTGFVGDSPASFDWDFGDGGDSPEQDPFYQFLIPGTYTVKLNVTDDDGDWDMETKTNFIVVVQDIQPVAAFTANTTTVVVNNLVRFTFTGSLGNAPNSFQWYFGDGSPNSTAQNPTHQYTLLGNYTVTLTVTDNDGDSSVRIRVNYIEVVPNIVPIASFTANVTTIGINQWVQFVFTGTDGNIPVTFSWDFGDGSPISPARDPSHQFTSLGNFTINLTITDIDGDTDTHAEVGYILVIDLIPIVDFTSNVTSIAIDEWVQFTFTGSEGDSPATYEWDFGDSSANSTNINPIHQYGTLGNYTVTLTVTDIDSDATTEVKIDFILVNDLIPVANFVADNTSVYTNQPIQFTFTGVHGNQPYFLFRWSFGDGGISTDTNPVYNYTSAGNYTVTLDIIDNDFDTDTLTITNFITVIEDLFPVAIFSANVTTINLNEYIGFTFIGFEGDAPATLTWDFGDNDTMINGTFVDHQFDSPGIFLVNLTVTDNDGDDDSYVLNVTVIDNFPTALFSANVTTITVNGYIRFTFSGSVGDAPATLTWDFGDGDTIINGTVVEHQFDRVGTFKVNLTVTDVDGDVASLDLTIIVEQGVSPIIQFFTDYWYVLVGAIVAVVGVTAAAVARRQKATQAQLLGKKKVYTKKEILAQMRHLFVFHQATSVCLLYQPFTQTTIDPQLIAGFVSAISTFGGQFDKKAKLRVLEYQSFKIIMEETDYARYALLIDGEVHEGINNLYNQFIYEFETKYGTSLADFKGDITPFTDAPQIIRELFEISKPSTVATQVAPKKKEYSRISASGYHVYCVTCQKWELKPQKHQLTGNETCPTCGKSLFFVPRCWKCGHSILKLPSEFETFKSNPQKCEKCGGPMYIQ